MSLESDRKLARAPVLKDRPGLLILSPPCTRFSHLQILHPQGLPAERSPAAWKEAIAFVDFAMERREEFCVRASTVGDQLETVKGS